MALLLLAGLQSIPAPLYEAAAVDGASRWTTFRRVTLHDPQLPAELLPVDWPGPAAYVLCRDFYRLTHQSAERHLGAILETRNGPLPPAAPYFFERFGGL